MSDHLPQEIVANILCRLPVKSLLICRCVSKSWNSMISYPQFVKRHLQRSLSSDGNYTAHRLLFACEDGDHCLKSCSLLSIYAEPVVDAVELDHEMKASFYRDLAEHDQVRVVGSCNGLLCIVIRHELVHLYNPCTRKSKRLPSSGFRYSRGRSFINYGFGYAESTDDYKVVAVCKVKGNSQTQVMVYSLRTN